MYWRIETEPAPAAVTVPLLEALDLVKDYRSGSEVRRALDGVSLSVGQGRFLSVMGPSGSGKSTLLHLLGGLDRPTGGEVLLEGRSLGTLSDRELTEYRRRVGFVFQSFNLIPVLTVAENVALPLVIDGCRRAEVDRRVRDTIADVGLEAHADALPSRLSGGEQQRTAIARALVTEPAVLLADEPTGNLDSATGEQVLSVLKTAQRERGQAIVVVTHDPDVAAVGDEVLHLRDGAVTGCIQLGPDADGSSPAQRLIAWLSDGAV